MGTGSGGKPGEQVADFVEDGIHSEGCELASYELCTDVLLEGGRRNPGEFDLLVEDGRALLAQPRACRLQRLRVRGRAATFLCVHGPKHERRR